MRIQREDGWYRVTEAGPEKKYGGYLELLLIQQRLVMISKVRTSFGNHPVCTPGEFPEALDGWRWEKLTPGAKSPVDVG